MFWAILCCIFWVFWGIGGGGYVFRSEGRDNWQAGGFVFAWACVGILVFAIYGKFLTGGP